MVPPVIAVAVLYTFWKLVKTMMGMTKAPELEWNRAAYLFAGVEVVAYAAAGFIFGREVHRQRAEQVGRRAGSGQQRAAESEKKAAEETTEGQTLRRVTEARKFTRHERAPDVEGLENFRGGANPARAAGQLDIDELSRVAGELFP